MGKDNKEQDKQSPSWNLLREASGEDSKQATAKGMTFPSWEMTDGKGT